MLLAEYVPIYCLARDLGPRHRQNLRLAVDALDRFAGREGPVNLTSLCDDLVNRWLVALADSGKARWTLKGARAAVVALWNGAYADGLIEHPPRRVRTIAVPRTIPEAWDQAQLRALLAATERFGGCFGRFGRKGIQRRPFLRALVLTGYDTGLRLGDLERIRRDQVGTGGSLVMIQHKTGDPLLCHLRAETIAAIEATFPPDRERVFGGVLCRDSLYQTWRTLVAAAGLTGGTKKLRKTSATWVEAVCPGSAMAHLGHRTPGLAYRHYVDVRLLQQTKPLPPAIGDGTGDG